MPVGKGSAVFVVFPLWILVSNCNIKPKTMKKSKTYLSILLPLLFLACQQEEFSVNTETSSVPFHVRNSRLAFDTPEQLASFIESEKKLVLGGHIQSRRWRILTPLHLFRRPTRCGEICFDFQP